MKHRGDQTLINLLNNIRVGVITDCEKQLLKSKFIDEIDVSYPYDAIHIWGETNQFLKHNLKVLKTIPETEHGINAINKIPPNVPIINFKQRI